MLDYVLCIGILYYISCTVNPILYSLLSHRYRHSLADVLGSGCCSSSLFARWRSASFARDQTTLQASPLSLPGNRSESSKRRDGRPSEEEANGSQPVAVKVFLSEIPSYGSIRGQSVEMRVVNCGTSKQNTVPPPPRGVKQYSGWNEELSCRRWTVSVCKMTSWSFTDML